MVNVNNQHEALPVHMADFAVQYAESVRLKLWQGVRYHCHEFRYAGPRLRDDLQGQSRQLGGSTNAGGSKIDRMIEEFTDGDSSYKSQNSCSLYEREYIYITLQSFETQSMQPNQYSQPLNFYSP